ncbi:MAG: hypothetical protein WA770_23180, partial [Pseudolabrys sp.]
SSLIGCSFILEEAVNPESAKDSVRYQTSFQFGEFLSPALLGSLPFWHLSSQQKSHRQIHGVARRSH